MPDMPLSLLVVHQGAELYGSDKVLLSLLEALQRQLFNITLHVPCSGPLLEKTAKKVKTTLIAPISILRLSKIKSLAWLKLHIFWQNLRFAQRQLQSHDAVILNTCVILSYMLMLPFWNKRKYIYVHEITTGLQNLIFNILLKLTGAIIICNSQATARSYRFISNKHKVIIYNTTSNPVKQTDLAEFDTFNILLIGRLSERKGFHVMVEALSFLPQNIAKKVHLRIVGSSFLLSDPYKQKLESLVAQSGYNSQITFLPFTDNPTLHYHWSHLVVVPSIKPESFGLVALEAMHQARPVIASAIGALPEITTHDITGKLVPPNNAQALADAIIFYLNHPEALQHHGQAGQHMAMQKFNIDYYQSAIQRVIHV